MAIIQTKKLTKIYKNGENKVPVLDQIDLIIEQGEMIALTGPSGAGKSTLMYLLGCLDVCTSGEYILNGKDISGLTLQQLAEVRNKEFGFVFQNFHLLPDLDATENVLLPQLYGGINQNEARKRAHSLLELVGLGHRLEYYPHQLSGGQKQRIAIARALAMDPKIILADEPTGNLDTENAKLILELLGTINQMQKTTMVIVTHDPKISNGMQRCIGLLDGKINFDKR